VGLRAEEPAQSSNNASASRSVSGRTHRPVDPPAEDRFTLPPLTERVGHSVQRPRIARCWLTVGLDRVWGVARLDLLLPALWAPSRGPGRLIFAAWRLQVGGTDSRIRRPPAARRTHHEPPSPSLRGRVGAASPCRPESASTMPPASCCHRMAGKRWVRARQTFHAYSVVILSASVVVGQWSGCVFRRHVIAGVGARRWADPGWDWSAAVARRRPRPTCWPRNAGKSASRTRCSWSVQRRTL
jgi:hypothetical protein